MSLRHKALFTCVSAALTVGGLAAATPEAFAKERSVVVTGQPAANESLIQRVQYTDLNLATAGGEKSLDRRVGLAVRQVCLSQSVTMSGEYGAAQGCQEFVWDDVRPQIGRAVARAREIAATGFSAIPAVAIAIRAPQK